MLIDWEAVVHDLEAHIRGKNSHGQRELTDLLADLRVQHRQTEGLPEKVGRVYLPVLVEEMSRLPARPADVDAGQMEGSSLIRSSQSDSERGHTNGH